MTAPLTFQGGNIFGAGTAVQGEVDSNITLQGNVSIEPMSNGLPNLAASPPLNQPLLLTGTITDNGGGFGMTINGGNGTSTITLAGKNTYSGSTVVSAGTLVYSGNDIAPHASKLVLGGATFSTGGHNQTMKSLTVSNSSATALATIDMGATTSAAFCTLAIAA